MYSISAWASRHARTARIVIIASYFVITGLGLFIGDALQLFDIAIPVSCFYAAVVLFLSVFLMYPDKRHKHRFNHFYRYRKTCDFILIATTFFFIVCIGNQPQRMLQLSTQTAAATAVFYTNETTSKPAVENKNTVEKPEKRLSEKALRRLLIQKIQVLRKAYKETSKGGKIALIALSVIVATGLIFLLAGLSCSLSCSGSEGLAVLVAVLGISLITFLLIRVIRRITKGPKPKDIPSPTT